MFGVFISFAVAAAAIEPPAAQPSQSTERICRGGGARTLGSHMRSRRRCLTAAQWQQEDEARDRPAPGAQITGAQNDGRTNATPR